MEIIDCDLIKHHCSVLRKAIKNCEMWFWGRILKIIWTDCVKLERCYIESRKKETPDIQQNAEQKRRALVRNYLETEFYKMLLKER